MRVVFMGTPDFSVPCLNALVEAGHEVMAVVTQPDRPRGRGQQMAHSPVKAAALSFGLKILQPSKVREADFIATLKELAPEVIVVVAFGQILPGEILDLPLKGCINVHASLLPKYRGAAPIHWAVIEGEKQTGVTTMYMDRGLDTGDMLLKGTVEIGESATVGEVHDKLADLGARVLIETLANLDKIERLPQDHAASTYAPMLTREHEQINWGQDRGTVVNLIHGLNPWPGAYT
ncbi:MAG TPA: methionyl-tRNA formyltransferase, partial [Verrucomicrobiae bacterium]|nr:methionyl-tRNA formyltransferase [Verrucomicrobiae bacterium]